MKKLPLLLFATALVVLTFLTAQKGSSDKSIVKASIVNHSNSTLDTVLVRYNK